MRIKLLYQDRGARPVAGKYPVRQQSLDLVGLHVLRHHFLARRIGGLASHQSLGLREKVGHQDFMMATQRIVALAATDEVGGDHQGSLMQQLDEGMLSILSGRAPDDRCGCIIHRPAIARYPFPVAFHLELLEVIRKQAQGLVVRQNSMRGRSEEVDVPDTQHAEHDRKVALDWNARKMIIHFASTPQKPLEVVHADGESDRETYRGPDRIATPDPVPELEGPPLIDSELPRRCDVRSHRRKMTRCSLAIAGFRYQPFTSGARARERLERRKCFT